MGQPLEAASTATAAASAAAQRSTDRVRGSGLPLSSDRCLMAALLFSKISEFGTRGEPKHAFGRADWRRERKEKARATHLRLIF